MTDILELAERVSVPQFCFSDWWNSLKDTERAMIIRDPQSAKEILFKAGYAAALRAIGETK